LDFYEAGAAVEDEAALGFVEPGGAVGVGAVVEGVEGLAGDVGVVIGGRADEIGDLFGAHAVVQLGEGAGGGDGGGGELLVFGLGGAVGGGFGTGGCAAGGEEGGEECYGEGAMCLVHGKLPLCGGRSVTGLTIAMGAILCNEKAGMMQMRGA